MSKDDQYKEYLSNHIQNVKNGYEWLKLTILPNIDIDLSITDKLIKYHDSSKYSIEEFDSYRDYFYDEQTDEVKRRFDYAWLHHIHNNPHHWKYWLLQEDDGDLKALDIPIQYIIEMICDWWAFSWNKNDLFEIFKWYENNRDKQNLSIRTREVVETILHEMKTQLTYYPEEVFNEK